MPVGIDPSTLYGFYAMVYLPTVAHTSKAWLSQIGWAMDKYVIPEFGDRKIGDISRAELQGFFNRLKMETSSKRRIKIVLGCVFNLAEDDEICKSPVRRVRLPMDRKPDKTALTFEQLWTLLENAQPRAIPVILLGGFCGLRIGEICGSSRADFSKNVFRLRWQVRQEKGGCERTNELKTPQSERDIPLPPVLMERLFNAGQVSGIYLASDSKGGYLTPNNATRELAEACKRAELGKWEGEKFIPLVSPHELRHTFISLMENELEAPPRIVACLAGRKYNGPNAGYSHTHETQLLRWMTRYWEQASSFACRTDCRTEGQTPGSIELTG